MDDSPEPQCPHGSHGPRVSFAGVPCPDALRIRTLTLLPSDALEFRETDWADALVIVERGELEVECVDGLRAQFRSGAVLTFARLPLLRLRNPGAEPLVLSAVSRAEPADRAVPGPGMPPDSAAPNSSAINPSRER